MVDSYVRQISLALTTICSAPPPPFPPQQLPTAAFHPHIYMLILPRVVPPTDVETAEHHAEIVEGHPKGVVLVVADQAKAGAPTACPKRGIISPVPSPLLCRMSCSC